MIDMQWTDRLERKVRFPPMMGGNSERITLPCTLVGRLLGLAAIVNARCPDYEQEIRWLEMEVEGLMKKDQPRVIHRQDARVDLAGE